MRVVISGGGTAGHVTPGLALGGELTGRGHDVSFVGTDRGVEVRIVPAAGFELHVVTSRPFVRKVSLDALRAPVAAVRAIGTCRPWVRASAVVVGMGGYASAPAVLAARRERVPIVLHEQNAIPGLANRMLSRVAKALALSFPEAASRFPRRVPTIVTGNPVRGEILAARDGRARDAFAAEGRGRYDLRMGRRTAVIFGGSLGALHIDQAAIGACRILRERSDLQVVLITGPDHLEAVRRAWPGSATANAADDGLVVRTEGFVDRMEIVYAVADLVVARGGASSVAEISALGIPSILIPYPHAAAGEQEANARALERSGGATVMLDRDVTAEALALRIGELIDQPERLSAMAAGAAAFGRPRAASELADLVEEVAR
jgi:UDP-N-acetylglucosamine--N-acetylmuramyl-(pentapeptide) pyrophosphoryl-undecaprenol N-acetylglucosamine transferase